MKLFATHARGDPDDEGRKPRTSLFAVAVGVLFAIVATPLETSLAPFQILLDAVYESPDLTRLLAGISGKFASSPREDVVRLMLESFVLPVKKLGFVFSVATLLYFAFKNLKRAPWLWLGWRERLRTAGQLSFLLACLVLPLKLRSLGDSYARLSLSPFDEPFGIFYRRLLMAGLANTVGLSGYVLYLLFSILLTVVLVYLVLSFFQKNGVRLSIQTLLSLFTSSFVLYGFEMPGYPDQLAMIFLLLMILLPESPYGRLSLVALSLATHETSMLMILPVAFVTFTKRERYGLIWLVAAYALLAVAGLRFDVVRLFTTHAYFDVTGNSAWDYLITHPLLAMAGILVAFKLFWIVGCVAAIKAWRNAERSVAWSILTPMLLPLVIIPFAVDTSRFAGFGFLGLLVALQYVVEREVLKPKALNTIAIVNLILPSVYVGLNSGVQMFPGLYHVVYGWLM